jgi:hypothetical protein
MAYEIKENNGSSWPNDYKEAGDSRPVMQGKFRLSKELAQAVLDGKTLTIASWSNLTEGGKKYLSHKFSVYEPKQKKVDEEEVEVDLAPF